MYTKFAEAAGEGAQRYCLGCDRWVPTANHGNGRGVIAEHNRGLHTLLDLDKYDTSKYQAARPTRRYEKKSKCYREGERKSRHRAAPPAAPANGKVHNC